MLVTISSVRGSPGVTSWALLLAASWPSDLAPVRVVLEADCSGGVLGARYQLGVEPGAVSLMSACRRASSEIDPASHGRLLDEGLWVIPGPEVAEQAMPIWQSGVADVAAALAPDDRLWVVDVGRSEPGSPVRLLVEQASVNVVVTRGAVEDVVQARARVATLDQWAPTVVIVTGKSDFPEHDLHRFLGGRKLWVVPSHHELPLLTMRAVQGGRARRSSLWRAATEVAADLAAFAERNARPARPAPLAMPSRPSTESPEPSVTEAGPPTPPPERRLDRLPEVGVADEASPAMRAAVANSYLLGEGNLD